MRRTPALLPGLAALACIGPLFGQAEFRVYREHPRLFLEPARLERLRKDVGRQSLRWRALRDLVEAGAAFPEQPLVDALRYQVEGSEEAGRKAVGWSEQLAREGIRTASDLRQAAIVYDWCHELFDSEGRSAAGKAISEAVEQVLPSARVGAGLVRSAILASIAVAGDWAGSERALGELLRSHWDGEVLPELAAGGLPDDGAGLIAVLEASLAVRHNLETDLLRRVTDALASLVRTRLLSYYPLDIETAEGLARRPSAFGSDDAKAAIEAPLYRLAEMLLVAYEPNLREFQFVQGWIRDDTYMLRSPLAAPYEFLWVNPYLPGLTPQSAPPLAHDPVRGRLYGRLSWERPTTWIGYADGSLEIAADGSVSATNALEGLEPIYFPASVIVPVSAPSKFVLQWPPARNAIPEVVMIYMIGLRAGETYGLKVGGRPARLARAEAGGILILRSDAKAPKRDRIDLRRKVRVEVRPTLKPTDPRRPRPSLQP